MFAFHNQALYFVFTSIVFLLRYNTQFKQFKVFRFYFNKLLYPLGNNKFTPLETLHSVYYGLVYPYLSYCNIAWGTTFQSHLETLNRLQKRIIRLIHCESYLDHSEPLFRKSKILKLRDLIVYSILIYVFKNMNVFVGIDHAHSTRFSQNLRPRFRRTTLTQHSISFVGPKLWNELPAQLKCITSINSFKLLLKKFLCTEHNLSLNF